LKNNIKQYFHPFLRDEIGKILGLTLLLTPLSPPLFAEAPDNVSSVVTAENDSAIQLLPDLPVIQDKLSMLANIKVKQFQFEGNSVFSDEELSKITAPYEKEITAEELQEVKNKITQFYIEAGYTNSGAILPDQKVADGIITIKIIEGKLSRVEVIGNKNLNDSYIQERLKGKEGAILNINELQERLQMLQQEPLFETFQAELGPGVKLGESFLKMKVNEASPYQFQFVFNNYRSPSVGAYRGEIRFWHHNFTGFLMDKGWGDTLYLRYGITEGLNDVTLIYDLPLNNHGTTLSFNIERSDSEVVEKPFSQLNIESEVDTYAITLRTPLIKRLRTTFDLALRLEKRISHTYLLTQPFSFSPGVEEGKSNLSVIRFSQDFVNRSTFYVLAARSSFNFGVDANSTINDDGSPDSQFFTWLGQFQYVRQLDFLSSSFLKESRVIFRTDFQWAREELLPLEKLSIGGAMTVRGYRENQLTRDNALLSSLELRIPLLQKSIPGTTKKSEGNKLELSLFADYGRAWDTHIETPEPKDIYSIGLGLNWSLNEKINTQVYWGYALRDIPVQNEKNLQDDGVHFEMSVLF
jgi:hemolysin activation/secretion protein